MKLLEENRRETLQDIGMSIDVLDKSPKVK
jgi:hypothetical protein